MDNTNRAPMAYKTKSHEIFRSTASTIDIPGRRSPHTKQQPTGLLFASPAARPCCSSPFLAQKKKDQNTVPAPRQTFPDGDPRALNNSPPGCCLPRLWLGRAVRVPSTHKKRKTRTHCVLVFLGAMEGTRTPGLLIRSQSLYPAELPTHVLRARNMMYYSTGSELCQHFFAIIFLLFFRGHGKAQTFCVFVIPFLYQL